MFFRKKKTLFRKRNFIKLGIQILGKSQNFRIRKIIFRQIAGIGPDVLRDCLDQYSQGSIAARIHDDRLQAGGEHPLLSDTLIEIIEEPLALFPVFLLYGDIHSNSQDQAPPVVESEQILENLEDADLA